MRFLALLLLLFAQLASASVRVCLLGDSITDGFAPATRSWSVDLKALHPGEDLGVKSVAESGYTASQASARLHSDVLGRGCTHVVIFIGTNDAFAGTPAADTYATIDAMATLAEADGAQVLLPGLLPRGTGIAWTAAMEARRVALNALLAARSGSTYVDTSSALTGTASGTAWAPSTAYSLDNVRVNGGNAYICTTAGTSAGSGGPTGTGTGIVDGTAVWSYIPALGSEWGGATDGTHPSNAGMAEIARVVDAAATW